MNRELYAAIIPIMFVLIPLVKARLDDECRWDYMDTAKAIALAIFWPVAVLDFIVSFIYFYTWARGK